MRASRPRLRTRHRRAALALAMIALALGACSDASRGGGAFDGPGAVDEAWFQERQRDALAFATRTFAPSNPLNVIAHLERARIEPEYSIPGAVPDDAFDDRFAKMAALEDTRDFDALYLLNLLLGYRDDPVLSPALVEKLERALFAFKFWYTEPTAPGLVDDSYYWTENHEVIYATLEFLMGQEYPERTFANDGRSGAEHRDRARERLLRWFELRARFGFSEWHSNVYYQKDLTPLLTLVELADDDEIRTRAAMVLDLLLFDMALHTHRGAFGSTHGRSYKKDKMSSLDDDTWGGVKLLFGTATYDYQSSSHPDAVLLARARRYRMPEAILRVARSTASFTDRERMGIRIDEDGPFEDAPQAPYGFSFDDPRDLTVWWGIGALTTWPVVPLTLRTMEQYDLWNTTNFAPFADLRVLTANPRGAQQLAIATHRFLGFGLLNEVNTVTHRTADYMLSSAVDYRAGSFASQIHTWQATLDANAIVFTNHPFRPIIASQDWGFDEEQGGYWTGEASVPRAAQVENVGLYLYAPKYPMRSNPPFEYFRWEPYTHAYFPQDHFDEVVEDGKWVFGRLGDGYVALWSWRDTSWLEYDPAVYATRGMLRPFDLVAHGGADNVWIVECGRAEEWGGFAAFRAAVAAAEVRVEPLGPVADDGVAAGFAVEYASPSQGRLRFASDGPLEVNGVERPLADFPRFDNPFAQVPFDSPLVEIAVEGYAVTLDFAAGRRTLGAPR